MRRIAGDTAMPLSCPHLFMVLVRHDPLPARHPSLNQGRPRAAPVASVARRRETGYVRDARQRGRKTAGNSLGRRASYASNPSPAPGWRRAAALWRRVAGPARESRIRSLSSLQAVPAKAVPAKAVPAKAVRPLPSLGRPGRLEPDTARSRANGRAARFSAAALIRLGICGAPSASLVNIRIAYAVANVACIQRRVEPSVKRLSLPSSRSPPLAATRRLRPQARIRRRSRLFSNHHSAPSPGAARRECPDYQSPPSRLGRDGHKHRAHDCENRAVLNPHYGGVPASSAAAGRPAMRPCPTRRRPESESRPTA